MRLIKMDAAAQERQFRAAQEITCVLGRMVKDLQEGMNATAQVMDVQMRASGKKKMVFGAKSGDKMYALTVTLEEVKT